MIRMIRIHSIHHSELKLNEVNSKLPKLVMDLLFLKKCPIAIKKHFKLIKL